jgi:very-short-patch-repair endonuclease
MTHKIIDRDINNIIDRYNAGESEQSIAKSYQVSRAVIRRRLLQSEVVIRNIKEANKLFSSQLTPAQKRAKTVKAHDAIRGKRQSEQHRAKIARFYETTRGGNVSVSENQIEEALQKRGVDVTPQKAIGRYNIDLALNVNSIALEIFGGGWHGYGRHATRFNERSEYLFDRGWTLIVVWVDLRRGFDPIVIADYAISLSEVLSHDPTARCKHYVIRGDGKPTTFGSNNINYRA